VKSGFDSENLMWLEQLFRQTVGNEMEIKRDDFNKILITKNVSLLIYQSYFFYENSNYNAFIDHNIHIGILSSR
jgi:hypothetical protein